MEFYKMPRTNRVGIIMSSSLLPVLPKSVQKLATRFAQVSLTREGTASRIVRLGYRTLYTFMC